MSDVNWIEKRALLSPHALALDFEGQQWTFADLYKEAHGTARALNERLSPAGGEKAGRVAVLADNSADFYILIAALMDAGIEMVLLNTRLSLPELAYQLADAQPALLLYAEAYKTQGEALVGELEEDLQVMSLKAMLTAGRALSDIQEDVTPWRGDRVMSILYTSGTTGRPKGVLQTYNNHLWSALAGGLNAGLVPGDGWVCVTPLFHVSGLSILVRSLVYGCPVYLFSRFDAAAVNRSLCDGRGTIISVVAYTLKALLDDLGDRRYPASFRYMLLGGGFFDEGLLARCADRDITVIRSFGMTETCSQMIATGLGDTAIKPASSGQALFPNRVRIDDGSLPPGAVGEIQVQSPALCRGYLNNAARYRQAFTADGWYKTGDIGCLDEEGYLYVKSRLTDLIISGGENIYPVEVEQCLVHHPEIRECAVIGREDARWGQVPEAYLVAADPQGPLPSPEALQAYCRQYLAAYKVPKHFIFLEDLPKTSIGKIQKQRLREGLHGPVIQEGGR
ncbi:o-succinylbenzoate--CoA ligase [Peptococcus simiae]|uniref:2-succinylbenzoate--CoA ligase n=1 Tax=Peptococcus simiae TaxID=1643805 RepID=A0ABW9H0J8_9FIRM